MAFVTRVRVRFGDEDHAQIVYYPRFYNFFHIAFEDFFNEQGHDYQKVLDVERLGFPTVHVETDFFRTLKFGDVFEIEVAVERVGRSSATFRYRGRKDGELAAEARMTVVCVDMRTWKAVEIPQPLRALFERNRV
ncbi:MAG TPA: thioesterase family protein [Polyangia bacterium]|nr:thioesterase family protein [Polyangia bacterium]